MHGRTKAQPLSCRSPVLCDLCIILNCKIDNGQGPGYIHNSLVNFPKHCDHLLLFHIPRNSQKNELCDATFLLQSKVMKYSGQAGMPP